ncbi:hypothetical protein LguiB_023459 [Lonicera macranthoides]
MANLRTAMDSAFWDLNISTPQTLDGWARSIPGEPIPMDAARASRALRMQQMETIKTIFPLGLIPSYSPKLNGSFAFQSLLLNPAFSNWWLGLVGQIRPKKLISAIKADVQGAKEWDLPVFKKIAKRFVDKSPYSIGLTSQLALSPSSSVLLSTEMHGNGEGCRNRAMFFHQLPDHDITLEAAWPELFIDHKGNYWDVPESISLDCSSLVSESGLRYRFGIHKNRGQPQAENAVNGEVPLALMPGLCAKGAFSYEKSKDLWRIKETAQDLLINTSQGPVWGSAFDSGMKEPHATVSGIIGGHCGAWFGGGKSSVVVESSEDNNINPSAKCRAPFGADLFGSACCTFQHGKFRKRYNDLTRIDARLDISSAFTLAKRAATIFTNSSVNSAEKLRSSPRLNLTLQQQMVGPYVFRLDSRILLDSSEGRPGPRIEDVTYSLTCSLRYLMSGKVVAWYSPKRKEGMVELRLFEF